MGEAKRRKLLDPNYGKPVLPVELQQQFDFLISKEKDLVVFYNDRFIYTAPEKNQAREFLLKNEAAIADSMPAIKDSGKGWLVLYEADSELGYFPSSKENLQLFQVFNAGATISAVVFHCLEKWIVSQEQTLIPVIAIPYWRDDPIWIFCI